MPPFVHRNFDIVKEFGDKSEEAYKYIEEKMFVFQNIVAISEVTKLFRGNKTKFTVFYCDLSQPQMSLLTKILAH